MSKLVNTYFTHDKERERLKKQIGKIKKVHFTQEEALNVLDSGDLTPLYDAFSAFIFKYANQLASSDAQGALSHYTDSFFMDLYNEGQMFLTLALQRYDREKNDNLMGYCMAYTKGGILQFKKRFLEGVFSNKSQYPTRENREKEGWVSVTNYGSYDDVTEKFDQLIEKTYNPEQKTYNETLIMDYILENNQIFKLTEDEKKALVLYFSDDKITLKELAEQLGISLNKMTYIYRSCRNKIRKHKQLIEEIL